MIGCSFRFVHVLKLGAVVTATMFVVWLPFLSSEQIPQVVHRIFPMARGLYEDHVASFWCAISPAFKFRDFPVQSMAKLRLASTRRVVLACLQLCTHSPAFPSDSVVLGTTADRSELPPFAFLVLGGLLPAVGPRAREDHPVCHSVSAHSRPYLVRLRPAFMLLHEMPTAMSAFLFVSMFRFVL